MNGDHTDSAGEPQETAAVIIPGRGDMGKFGIGNQAAKGHGRPPNAESLMSQLRARDNPKNAAKLANAVWKRAMAGESWAVEFVFNRLYGRVPQVTRIAGIQDGDGNERPIPLLLLPALPTLTEAADSDAME